MFLEVHGPIDGKIILVVCLFNEFFTTNNVRTVKVKNVNVRHHTCVLVLPTLQHGIVWFLSMHQI